MAALKRAGIVSALVAGAGDIVASSPPPGERGWSVGVADPADDPALASRTLLVRDAAVSTSGDSERFVEINGHRYSHIVDPTTGFGVERRASVTVVARDGTTADSLATAAFVLGVDRGLALIEQIGGSGLFIVAGSEPGTFASSKWSEAPQMATAAGTSPTAAIERPVHFWGTGSDLDCGAAMCWGAAQVLDCGAAQVSPQGAQVSTTSQVGFLWHPSFGMWSFGRQSFGILGLKQHFLAGASQTGSGMHTGSQAGAGAQLARARPSQKRAG